MRSSRSLAGRVASGLAKEFSSKSLVAKYNVVYRPDFKIIMRGVFVESTPYKNTVRMRNMYAIFLKQEDFVSLDFSDRIVNSRLGRGRDDFSGTLNEIISDVILSVGESNILIHLDDCSAMNDVIEKIIRNTPPDSRNLGRVSTLAALSLIKGDFSVAQEYYSSSVKLVNEIEKDYIAEHHVKYINQIKADAALFQSSPPELVSDLLRRIQITACHLGLQD